MGETAVNIPSAVSEARKMAAAAHADTMQGGRIGDLASNFAVQQLAGAVALLADAVDALAKERLNIEAEAE